MNTMHFRHLFAIALVAAPFALAACSSDAPDSPSIPSGTKDSGAVSTHDSGGGDDPVVDAGTQADSGTPGAGDGGNKGDGAIASDAAIPACPTGTNCPAGALCTSDTMCATNVCFQGGQTSFCTKKCAVKTQVTDCPKPDYLEICNNKGYCKLR